MSPQLKTPPAPLSERDAHALANAVGAGDEPKVLVLAADGGAPARGRLVGYTEGAAAPFRVRVTVNGTDRELELAAGGLAAVPRNSAEIIARTAGGSSAEAPAKPAAAAPAGPDGNGRAKPAKAAGRKPARGSAEVTITVTVTGDSVTVDAASGAKKLVKQVAMPVAVGRSVAQALGMDAVTDAVEGLVAEYRAAKEAEAEQLRARLAELEQELAEYTGSEAEAGSEPAAGSAAAATPPAAAAS